jgi:hypothetical protein
MNMDLLKEYNFSFEQISYLKCSKCAMEFSSGDLLRSKQHQDDAMKYILKIKDLIHLKNKEVKIFIYEENYFLPEFKNKSVLNYPIIAKILNIDFCCHDGIQFYFDVKLPIRDVIYNGCDSEPSYEIDFNEKINKSEMSIEDDEIKIFIGDFNSFDIGEEHLISKIEENYCENPELYSDLVRVVKEKNNTFS